jgi:hypothetical protein
LREGREAELQKGAENHERFLVPHPYIVEGLGAQGFQFSCQIPVFLPEPEIPIKYRYSSQNINRFFVLCV